DAILNVYPFKPVKGKGEEQFRRTRLMEMLTSESREAELAGPVEIKQLEVPLPGAHAALFARFAEKRAGTVRYRLRVAVFSGNARAIVDYNAANADAYQRNWPSVAGVLDSLKVSVGETPAPQAKARPAAPAGAADGLYLASTRRFVMQIGGSP